MSDNSEYTFDISTCFSPDEVHDLIASKLPLPEYYGGNLDALYEVLTDPHKPWKLTFTGVKAAEAVIGAKYMKALKKMCARAAEESEALTILFEDE